MKPKIVCLCGSSKWPGLHLKISMRETIDEGNIIIPMGCYGHADFPPGARRETHDGDLSSVIKQQLDKLHFRKIDLADEVLFITVGEFGQSTHNELVYAIDNNKHIRRLSFSLEEAEKANNEIGVFTDPVVMRKLNEEERIRRYNSGSTVGEMG